MFNVLKWNKRDWIRCLFWNDIIDGEFRTNAQIAESAKAVDAPPYKVTREIGYLSYFVHRLRISVRKDGYHMVNYDLVCAYPSLYDARAAVITDTVVPPRHTWYFDKDGNEVNN